MDINQEDFIYVTDVPVLDAIPEKDNVVPEEFNEQVLREFVANTNQRIADTGDYPPLYLNHTRKENYEGNEPLPAEEQPPLVGFAFAFRVGTIGDLNPRPAILATFMYLKTKYEQAREFTRRSPELWVEDRVIDAIALLKHRPERNLGVLYEKSINDDKYSHMEKDELIKACLEAVSALPQIMYINDVMKKQEEAAKMEAIKEQSGEEDNPMMDNEEEVDIKIDNKNKEEDAAYEKEPEKMKMQHDQQKRKYAKLEMEHKNLQDRLAAMETKSRLAERKAELLQLEQEGIQFDFAEEFDHVKDMETVHYEKHLGRMRKCYNKAPILSKPIRPAEPFTIDRERGDTSDAAQMVMNGRAKTIQEAFSMLRK